MVSRTRLATAVAASLAAAPAFSQNIGPSTAVSPYMLPARAGVSTTSLFTVNDPTSVAGGYRMVGIPDGMGAFAGPGNGITILMNHELGNINGIVRVHGFAGAFVSRWEMDRTTLAVTSGRDFCQAPSDVFWASQPARAWNRFCSADLAAPTAYQLGALGTDARILLNGEEAGDEGTGWAHVATGPATNHAYELPALGRFSWENALGCPYPQTKTIVMGTDDSSPGQVYIYVGTKTSTGNDIDRAGLSNGLLFGVKVPGVANETRGAVINATFEAAPLGSQIGVTGAQLQANSIAAGVTQFLRPEDGCWDERPGHGNTFYFVTTDTVTASGGRSRLYQLTFTDIGNPELGGTITTLLHGTEGGEMFDNMCVDNLGRILLQEDVGNNARLGRIWLYDLPSASFGEIAIANAGFFLTGAGNFLTQDEESSGIIDASSLLGRGWFLMCLQSHNNLGGELAQGGQMLAMFVDPSITLPIGLTAVGRSSPGCSGPLAVSSKTVPARGNAAFALSCLNAPPTGVGAAILTGSIMPAPLPILGIQVWVDPSTFLTAVGVSANAQGVATLDLPLPSSLEPGAVVCDQFIWFGPAAPPPCPPQGFSASNAVRVQVQ